MRLEKSCGAVIYKYSGTGRLYLIEHTLAGHTSLPKGHVETDETELQTAEREIREETNLEVAIDSRFRFNTHYITRKGLDKELVIFVAEPLTEDLVPQATEVAGFEWLPLAEALSTLEYDAHREALKQAAEYLDACCGAER